MTVLLHILWGVKTQAFFDVWSIEHVLSGISCGHMVRKKNTKELGTFLGKDHGKISLHFDLTGVLCLAYMWETFEHYLETGLMGLRVEHWLQGVEFWGNRMIADPLLLIVGYAIARRYPQLILPARILSAAWLFAHIFLFPDSMYLQRLIFGNA